MSVRRPLARRQFRGEHLPLGFLGAVQGGQSVLCCGQRLHPQGELREPGQIRFKLLAQIVFTLFNARLQCGSLGSSLLFPLARFLSGLCRQRGRPPRLGQTLCILQRPFQDAEPAAFLFRFLLQTWNGVGRLLGLTAGDRGGAFPPSAFLLFSLCVPFPLDGGLPHLKIRLHPF